MRVRHWSVLVLAAIVVPGTAEAQRRRYADAFRPNPFTLEAYGGALNDAYVTDGPEPGWLAGVRVGYALGSRTRLVGVFGYSEVDDVAAPAIGDDYFIYDNTWVLTTGGAEYDLIPGNTSAALGVQAGVGWRRVDVGGRVGTPDPGADVSDDGFASYEVIVPSLSLRRRITSRTELSVTVLDHMFDVLEGPVQHSPALTLGLRFR